MAAARCCRHMETPRLSTIDAQSRSLGSSHYFQGAAMFTATTRNRDKETSSSVLQRLRLGLLGLAAAVLAACGAADSDSPPATASACSDCGTALLTMTDAQGDFLSYTVEITSLNLKKANGAMVQTLPVSSEVDFAQLVEMSEVLSAGQVPSGQYVAATLGVDFTDADIVVEDAGGNGVHLTPVDANGQPLGQVELTVQLDNRNHLHINRARVSHLAFDLDLAASNTVNLGAGTVTVSPFVVATVKPPESRDVRARGRLVSVDVPGSRYTIKVRPFHEDAEAGSELVVHTTGTTRFEINGRVFTGADGLTQLATLADHPVTIAFGTIDAIEHEFTARRVLAATSAQDLHRDYLSGTVLSRTGNVLTVGGVRVGRRDGHFGFELRRVSVTVGPNTLVTRDGQGSGTMSIADISVGQHVEAFGDFSRDSTGQGSLDATAGRVRLNYTRLSGKVASVGGGGLTMALASINGHDPARFNFAGTGATPATDADPAQYEVSTGALGTASLLAGEYTRLFGFVTPFGTAPPDFRADTFVDFSDRRAGLALGWGVTGTTAPFSTLAPTALTVDLASGLRGAVKLGERVLDVTTLLTTGLQLVSASGDGLTFAIAHRASRAVDNFSRFADFSAALTGELNGTTLLYSVVAEGSFDVATGSFAARRLLVVLGN
jgi:hypothetical protein